MNTLNGIPWDVAGLLVAVFACAGAAGGIAWRAVTALWDLLFRKAEGNGSELKQVQAKTIDELTHHLDVQVEDYHRLELELADRQEAARIQEAMCNATLKQRDETDKKLAQRNKSYDVLHNQYVALIQELGDLKRERAPAMVEYERRLASRDDIARSLYGALDELRNNTHISFPVHAVHEARKDAAAVLDQFSYLA